MNMSENSDSSSKAPEKHGDHMRRNSTGKLSFSGSRPIPHYRTTYTGSCHDICKYGKAHTLEEKAKATPPWQKVVPKCGGEISSRRVSLPAMNKKQDTHNTSIKTPISGHKGRNKVDISHLSRNRHISVETELNKLNPSVLKLPLSDTPEISNVGSPDHYANGEISMNEASPSTIDMKFIIDADSNPSSPNCGTETHILEALAEYQNTERSMKPPSHSDAVKKYAVGNGESPIPTSIKKNDWQKMELSCNAETSRATEGGISHKSRRPPLKSPSVSVGSAKCKTPSTRNSMECSKPASTDHLDTGFVKKSGCSSRMDATKEILSSPCDFKSSPDRRNKGVDLSRNTVIKASEKKIQPPSSELILSSIIAPKTTLNTNYADKMRKKKPGRGIEGKDNIGAVVLKPSVVSSLKRTHSSGLRNKRSLKVGLVMKSPKIIKKIESRAVIPIANRNSCNEGNKTGSREKLLYSKKRPPFSSAHIIDAPSRMQLEPGCRDSNCGNSEGNRPNLKEKKPLKTLPGLANGKRKSKSFVPGNDECEATKVNFRRGKVVDTAPDIIRAPRRLKFRQVRLLTDKKGPLSTGWKRSFKRRDEAIIIGSTNKETEHEKIVLRHQNIEEGEKKDAQGLLNMVIEETASKLVMTRKSKVKALVGAFETVISLQEAAKSQLNTMVL